MSFRVLFALTALMSALAPANAGDIAGDELQIYTEALDSLARALPPNKHLKAVVSNRSMSMQAAYTAIGQPPPSSLEEDIDWRLTEAQKETIRSFAKRSADGLEVALVTASIHPQLQVQLVQRAAIDAIMRSNDQGAWERFSKEYPGTDFLIQFSPVGFNPNLTEAIVYLHRTCPGLCGSGELILLRKAKARWSVRQTYTLWMS